MPKYKYFAKDPTGITQKGLVEAKDEKHAVNLLHEKNYYVIGIDEVSDNIVFTNIISHGVNSKDITLFTRQLSTMIGSGLTLIEGLSILKRQVSKPSLIKLIRQIEEEVQGGSYFGDALSKHSKLFSPAYLSLVTAGEASGKLDTILTKLADNLEKSQEFKSKLRGAMIYPSVIIAAMIAVVILVITVVMPKLKELFKEFQVELPIPTRILLGITDMVFNYWIFIIVFGVVFIFIFLKFKKTKTGKHFFSLLALRMPVFGFLIKQSALTEVCRTLSLLIEGGVPILSALDIVKNITNNVIYQDIFVDVKKKVEKGAKLSEPLLEYSVFPAIFGEMIAVGEQTGKIDDSLAKLSHYFESETDAALKALTTMIEPVIMILLGIGVAFMVISVLMPIYTITSQIK